MFNLQLCLFFFNKMMQFYNSIKNICITRTSRISAELFSHAYWHHMRRKNTIEISSICCNVLLWIFSNCIELIVVFPCHQEVCPRILCQVLFLVLHRLFLVLEEPRTSHLSTHFLKKEKTMAFLSCLRPFIQFFQF